MSSQNEDNSFKSWHNLMKTRFARSPKEQRNEKSNTSFFKRSTWRARRAREPTLGILLSTHSRHMHAQTVNQTQDIVLSSGKIEQKCTHKAQTIRRWTDRLSPSLPRKKEEQKTSSLRLTRCIPSRQQLKAFTVPIFDVRRHAWSYFWNTPIRPHFC